MAWRDYSRMGKIAYAAIVTGFTMLAGAVLWLFERWVF